MFWGQKHPVSNDQLSAYADERVESAERARISAHVEACPTCREALSELAALRYALSAMPKAARPRSFALREADVRSPKTASGPFAPIMPMLSGVTMAAFVAFAVLVGVDMRDSGSSGDEQITAAGLLSAGQDRSPAPEAIAEPEFSEGTADVALQPPSSNESLDGGMDDRLVTATAYAAYDAHRVVPSATPPPPEAASVADDGGDNMALRAAQIATAAFGLVAGGSLVTVWWRRRV